MSVADPPDPIEALALAEAIRPALMRLSRRLRQETQQDGLSYQDAMLLGRIRTTPGLGVCGLAEAEQISRPTMSGHIKRLEAAGLVVRSEDAEDGRRSGLAVTAAGIRKLDALRRRRTDWLAARLAQLSPDERERLAAAAAPLLSLASVDP